MRRRRMSPVCPGCCDAGWSGPCTMWGSDGYLRGRISKLRYREIIYFKKKGLVQQSIYTSVAGNVTALHCFAAWIATNAIHLSISVLYEEPIIYLLCSLLLRGWYFTCLFLSSAKLQKSNC
jgi:hypothetical protein